MAAMPCIKFLAGDRISIFFFIQGVKVSIYLFDCKKTRWVKK